MQICLRVGSTEQEWGILVSVGLPYIRFALSHRSLVVPQFGQLLRAWHIAHQCLVDCEIRKASPVLHAGRFHRLSRVFSAGSANARIRFKKIPRTGKELFVQHFIVGHAVCAFVADCSQFYPTSRSNHVEFINIKRRLVILQ